MLHEKVKSFKNCIMEQRFYEAHEVLEEIWFPMRKTKDDFCLVLKGFINGAVSMELYKRGRIEQSNNIHKVYLKYVTQDRILKTEYSKEFFELQSFMDQRFQTLSVSAGSAK